MPFTKINGPVNLWFQKEKNVIYDDVISLTFLVMVKYMYVALASDQTVLFDD